MQLTDLVELLPPTPKSIKHAIRRYWTAKIGKAEARANDKDTAIEELRKSIKRAFDGDYCPYLLTFRGYQGIAWRTTQNWAYKVVSPDSLKQCEGALTRLWASSSYDTQQEVQNHLLFHLAEAAWDGQEETSSIIKDIQDQEQFGRNARWQKRYRELQASGKNDDDTIREQLRQEGL